MYEPKRQSCNRMGTSGERFSSANLLAMFPGMVEGGRARGGEDMSLLAADMGIVFGDNCTRRRLFHELSPGTSVFSVSSWGPNVRRQSERVGVLGSLLGLKLGREGEED
jgi:hypothetical protein